MKAIGKDRTSLCTGCLTGCYPVPIKGEISEPSVIDFLDGTYQSKLEFFDEN